jgi:hypothetical protein
MRFAGGLLKGLGRIFGASRPKNKNKVVKIMWSFLYLELRGRSFVVKVFNKAS